MAVLADGSTPPARSVGAYDVVGSGPSSCNQPTTPRTALGIPDNRRCRGTYRGSDLVLLRHISSSTVKVLGELDGHLAARTSTCSVLLLGTARSDSVIAFFTLHTRIRSLTFSRRVRSVSLAKGPELNRYGVLPLELRTPGPRPRNRPPNLPTGQLG